MLEKLTKAGITAKHIRIALLAMVVLVVLSGEVVAAQEVPEQCYNDQIWDAVKWVGGCPDVPGVYD
jgi:hypothetical protein